MGYKTYQTFDEFFTDQPTDKQEIITALRQLVRQAAPELTEGSKWGGGVWSNGPLPVIYIHVFSDYSHLGFFGGALLEDPGSVLEGKGKFIRHIDLRSPKDISKGVLTPLIQQAAKLDYKKKR